MAEDFAVNAGEKAAFSEEVAGNGLAPLWEIYQDLIVNEPTRTEPTVIWKWRELEPLVAKSADLVKGDDADHRVLILNNPHLDGPPATASTIVAGYQCVLPGEKTSPHRHTPAATRVILEGSGGATFVDGKRCDMFKGDLIITPNWTWHCHENDSEKRTIWLDVLDLPLVGKLDAVFGDMGPVVNYPENISTLENENFRSGGLLPETDKSDVRHSPRLRYPWKEVLQAIENAPPLDDGSSRLNYVNPIDGGPIIPTLSSQVLALRGEQETRSRRTTARTICVVMEGEGFSQIGNEKIDWEVNDVFTLPHWTWANHTAQSKRAIMITISDREIMKKLNLLREEVGS